jgi:hypothetical protein
MTKTTKMTKTIQLVLAIAMVASSIANAELKFSMKSTSVESDPAASAMQPAGSSAEAPQVKDDLFAGTEKFAQGASDVTEVNLDPNMMGMVGHNKDKDDKDSSASLARKMHFMVIHTYKYDQPGMYKMEDFEAYRKKLEDGSWSCSIRVRSKTGSTDICSRTAADKETNEMVILTAQPKELTFIHMSGKMSLDELNKMNNSPSSLVPR